MRHTVITVAFLISTVIAVSGCGSLRVDEHCLDSLKVEIEGLKDKREAKDFSNAEYISLLNDQFGLLESMELTNKIMKDAGHEYCSSDFTEVRWEVQTRINDAVALSLMKRKKK